MGCESEFVGSVPDDYDRTKEMLLQAVEKYDAVFTTGGVSVVTDRDIEKGEKVNVFLFN